MARSHRYPICPDTGKRRLGERKDVRLARRGTRQLVSSAQQDDVPCHRREVRGYKCPACRGWHLTSLKAWQPNPRDGHAR